jgi:hypothetical protein
VNDFLTIQNDLGIASSDLLIGHSHAQHTYLLLACPQGSFKENPDVGVGLIRFTEAENPADLLREIRQQCTADAMEVKKIGYNEQTGKLELDADYRTV